MLREIARVRKPVGHVAIFEVICTGRAVEVFRESATHDARRLRSGTLRLLVFALSTLGASRLSPVVGHKQALHPTA
jgi:hypothetical protein